MLNNERGIYSTDFSLNDDGDGIYREYGNKPKESDLTVDLVPTKATNVMEIFDKLFFSSMFDFKKLNPSWSFLGRTDIISCWVKNYWCYFYHVLTDAQRAEKGIKKVNTYKQFINGEFKDVEYHNLASMDEGLNMLKLTALHEIMNHITVYVDRQYLLNSSIPITNTKYIPAFSKVRITIDQSIATNTLNPDYYKNTSRPFVWYQPYAGYDRTFEDVDCFPPMVGPATGKQLAGYVGDLDIERIYVYSYLKKVAVTFLHLNVARSSSLKEVGCYGNIMYPTAAGTLDSSLLGHFAGNSLNVIDIYHKPIFRIKGTRVVHLSAKGEKRVLGPFMSDEDERFNNTFVTDTNYFNLSSYNDTLKPHHMLENGKKVKSHLLEFVNLYSGDDSFKTTNWKLNFYFQEPSFMLKNFKARNGDNVDISYRFLSHKVKNTTITNLVTSALPQLFYNGTSISEVKLRLLRYFLNLAEGLRVTISPSPELMFCCLDGFVSKINARFIHLISRAPVSDVKIGFYITEKFLLDVDASVKPDVTLQLAVGEIKGLINNQPDKIKLLPNILGVDITKPLGSLRTYVTNNKPIDVLGHSLHETTSNYNTLVFPLFSTKFPEIDWGKHFGVEWGIVRVSWSAFVDVGSVIDTEQTMNNSLKSYKEKLDSIGLSNTLFDKDNHAKFFHTFYPHIEGIAVTIDNDTIINGTSTQVYFKHQYWFKRLGSYVTETINIRNKFNYSSTKTTAKHNGFLYFRRHDDVEVADGKNGLYAKRAEIPLVIHLESFTNCFSGTDDNFLLFGVHITEQGLNQNNFTAKCKENLRRIYL